MPEDSETVTVTRLSESAAFPATPSRTGEDALTDDFEIVRVLGQGGMGVVLLARQLSLQREVAVKLLHARHAFGARAAESFLREARVLASLNHPNIVAIHQAGTLPDGRLFFAMEYVKGRTLDDRAAEYAAARPAPWAPLPANEIFQVLFGLCDALACAHERGIVHRDIKPQNVLIDDSGRVRLTDFGIAVLQQLGATASNVAGTPAYMAPEQTAGGAVDKRADVYALGGVLFFLLTGRPPHAGNSVVSMMDKAGNVAGGVRAAVGPLPAGLPPAVLPLLESMLAADPDRRVPSIGDVRRRLESLYLQEVRGTRSKSPWLSPKRLLKAAALVLVPTAVAATLILVHQSAESGRTRGLLQARIDSVERELAAQVERRDFSPQQRTLLRGWAGEIRLRRDRGDLAGAAAVGQTVEHYLATQEILALAESVRAAWTRSSPPELQPAISEFLREADEMRREPAEADVARLRSQALALLRQLAAAQSGSAPP